MKADGTWGDGVTPNTLWNGMHHYPINYVPSDLSNRGWNQLGFCSIYYTEESKINNQPSVCGQLINIPADDYAESTQLWIDQSSGDIFSRRGNGFTPVNDGPFKRFATLDEVNTCEKVDSRGTYWIRYKSGLQLCWADYVGEHSWWSFPVAFSSTPVVQFTDTTGDWPWVTDISTTGCSHKSDGVGLGFAIGWWK